MKLEIDVSEIKEESGTITVEYEPTPCDHHWVTHKDEAPGVEVAISYCVHCWQLDWYQFNDGVNIGAINETKN